MEANASASSSLTSVHLPLRFPAPLYPPSIGINPIDYYIIPEASNYHLEQEHHPT